MVNVEIAVGVIARIVRLANPAMRIGKKLYDLFAAEIIFTYASMPLTGSPTK